MLRSRGRAQQRIWKYIARLPRPRTRCPLVSYASAIRKPVDPTAVATMALLCFIWGFGHVAAKLAAPGISLVMQGGLRCTIALVLLVGWARLRAIPLFDRDGTFWP